MRCLPLTSLLLAFAVSPLACDCGAEPVTRRECHFEVDPSGEGQVVTFNPTAVGEEIARSFNIKNTGNVPLADFEFTFEAVNGQHFDVNGTDDFAVAPTEEGTLTVAFHPRVVGDLASRFVVSHPKVGDSKCPSFTVFVRGTGFSAPDPDAGFPDAGFPDAGPDEDLDAGVIDHPDAGIVFDTDVEYFAYGALEDARIDFAAVPLASGSIVVIGGTGEDGEPLDTIERLDPTTGRSRIVARLATPRAQPGAARLPDGRIAIVGGRNTNVNGFALTSLEIFDPTSNAVTCPAPQGTCGLGDLDDGVLPEGRVGPVITHTTQGLVVALGHDLDANGDVVPLDGALLLELDGDVSATPLPGSLAFRTHAATNIDSATGHLLIVGGRDQNDNTLTTISRVTGTGAATVGQLAFGRSDAALARLEDGQILVAGGANAAGFGVSATERIASPFSGSATVNTVPLELPPRVGASLLAFADDILLYTGGFSTRTDDLDTVDSQVPSTSASVLVPFGSTFLVLAAENELAHGRVQHAAFVVGEQRDTAIFIGGSNVAPRVRPQPHLERFLLNENRFLAFSLMGAGAAFSTGLVADSGAAVVSAGGLDPHTGRVSDAVRAFDAEHGRYVEAAPLTTPRRDHSLTRIATTDDQTLLVVGGRDASGQVLGSISVLDPVNGSDRVLGAALITPRANHSATRLHDDNPIAIGAVLVCGGVGELGVPLDTCEVVVPPPAPLTAATDDEAHVVTVAGRMSAGRVHHTATLLDNGEVLLVGGGDIVVDQVRADLFIADEDQPLLQASGQPHVARREHGAMLLGSDRVLLAGGIAASGSVAFSRSAEVYVRATESFVLVADMQEARGAPALFLLADGNVLVSGGTRSGLVASDELRTRSLKNSELYITGDNGIGEFFALTSDDAVDLSFGRADVRALDVFGRAVLVFGTHRDGIVLGGDDRHSPVTFVDMLQAPADAIAPEDPPAAP